MPTALARLTEVASAEGAVKRSSFGPVLLMGLASAGLMAVAASQTWLQAEVEGVTLRSTVDVAGSDAAPVALASALVALAGWGVILVTGARARRLAAGVCLIATFGTLVVVSTLWSGTEDVVTRVLANQGISEVLEVGHRPWYWVTAAAGLAQVVAALLALLSAPSWPTMSSRYDAPTNGPRRSGTSGATDAGEVPDLELWKALDEGHDPTAGPSL